MIPINLLRERNCLSKEFFLLLRITSFVQRFIFMSFSFLWWMAKEIIWFIFRLQSGIAFYVRLLSSLWIIYEMPKLSFVSLWFNKKMGSLPRIKHKRNRHQAFRMWITKIANDMKEWIWCHLVRVCWINPNCQSNILYDFAAFAQCGSSFWKMVLCAVTLLNMMWKISRRPPRPIVAEHGCLFIECDWCNLLFVCKSAFEAFQAGPGEHSKRVDVINVLIWAH